MSGSEDSEVFDERKVKKRLKKKKRRQEMPAADLSEEEECEKRRKKKKKSANKKKSKVDYESSTETEMAERELWITIDECEAVVPFTHTLGKCFFYCLG